MKKYIGMLLVTIMLIVTMGCQSTEVEQPMKVNTLCIDGVTYVYIKEWSDHRGWGYMSVKLDQNSKIVPCEVTE